MTDATLNAFRNIAASMVIEDPDFTPATPTPWAVTVTDDRGFYVTERHYRTYDEAKVFAAFRESDGDVCRIAVDDLAHTEPVLRRLVTEAGFTPSAAFVAEPENNWAQVHSIETAGPATYNASRCIAQYRDGKFYVNNEAR